MKKYKYKVGQKVKYKITEYVENICPTCGHEEIDSKTIRVSGKILKKYYDFIYRPQTIISKRKDNIYTPTFSEIKPIEPKPLYDIKRDSKIDKEILEDSIKPIKVASKNPTRRSKHPLKQV